jgi:hypothetical protein
MIDKMAHFGRNESTLTMKSPASTIQTSSVSAVMQCSEEREVEHDNGVDQKESCGANKS